MDRIVRLTDLVIPTGQTDSNVLTDADFDDADLLTIYGTAPIEGTIAILVSFRTDPGIADWRLFGSNNHSATDPGLKLANFSTRTIPVAFRAIKVSASLAQTAPRTHPVTKRVAFGLPADVL